MSGTPHLMCFTLICLQVHFSQEFEEKNHCFVVCKRVHFCKQGFEMLLFSVGKFLSLVELRFCVSVVLNAAKEQGLVNRTEGQHLNQKQYICPYFKRTGMFNKKV